MNSNKSIPYVTTAATHAQAARGRNEQAKPPPSKPREIMQRPGDSERALHSTWTDASGLRIHSLASVEPPSPTAPAVVLVHGSGLSGRYMVPTARELARDLRIFVPDLPGFGDSDKPRKALDVPELADALAAWMPAIGLDSAALLGNSFGCQVIADLAARHPERVERAILQGPTTPPEERNWFLQFIRWRQNQRYNPPALGPITYEDYRKCGLLRMYRSFHYQLTDRIEDKAPHILAPVLVVRGSDDPISNQGWCEEIARLCPRGRLALIPGVAHTLCYTAAIDLANVTRSFVTDGSKDQTHRERTASMPITDCQTGRSRPNQ